MDDVPAATLLLPYFEVELGNLDGTTTLFSINNASATARVAQVTLWTDWAIPTLRFPIYLTGFDVQTINVRDLFNGHLPITAPDNFDPTDSISNQGPLSADTAIPGCTALGGTLDPIGVTELRQAHQGQSAPGFGGCLAEPWEDGRVRGYITIDVVTTCSDLSPADPAYYAGVLGSANVLWGKGMQVDPGNNAAQGESLVALEACAPGSCPFGPGSHTFYERYVDSADTDGREPLPSVFLTSFLNGGAFDGGTELTVWRDTQRPPVGEAGARPCGPEVRPGWWQLLEDDVVAFDEQENVADLCFQYPGAGIPVGGPPRGCWGLASQRIGLDEATPQGEFTVPPFNFGWMYLNLRHEQVYATTPGGAAQGWVTATMTALDRYSVGFDAAHLDNLCQPGTGQSLVLIP